MMNMKLLAVVTPPSIYHSLLCKGKRSAQLLYNMRVEVGFSSMGINFSCCLENFR